MSQDAGNLSAARVIAMGCTLLAVGTLGFYSLPGMIKEDASGSRAINAFYCTVVTLATVGYGDICPGSLPPLSKAFIVLLVFTGMGFFCGPMAELASSWRVHVPGGLPALASFTIGVGATLFTVLEGLSQFDAIYASIVTGVTIGYGDLTPATDYGKILIACYIIASLNVVAMLLQPGRQLMERLCRDEVKEKVS